MAVFAFSHRVQLAGWTVLSYQSLFRRVAEPLAYVYRSSGRFIWPLHYLCIAGAVAGVVYGLRRRPAWAGGLLAVAAVVEAGELYAAPERFTSRIQPLKEKQAWGDAGAEYRHFVVYPPMMVDGAGRGCDASRTFGLDVLLPYAWQAWRTGMTFNSAYISRLDEPRIHAYCQQLDEAVAQGRLDEDSVYLVHSKVAASFLASTAGRATCGELEGQLTCVAASRQGAFARRLAASPPQARPASP
jgi:hypothetical protein